MTEPLESEPTIVLFEHNLQYVDYFKAESESHKNLISCFGCLKSLQRWARVPTVVLRCDECRERDLWPRG